MSNPSKKRKADDNDRNELNSSVKRRGDILFGADNETSPSYKKPGPAFTKNPLYNQKAKLIQTQLSPQKSGVLSFKTKSVESKNRDVKQPVSIFNNFHNGSMQIDSDDRRLEFISLVRKFPWLYNPTDPFSRDFRKKEETWSAISTVTGMTVDKCQMYWDFLRNKFKRESRKPRDKVPQDFRQLMETALSFLESVIKPKSLPPAADLLMDDSDDETLILDKSQKQRPKISLPMSKRKVLPRSTVSLTTTPTARPSSQSFDNRRLSLHPERRMDSAGTSIAGGSSSVLNIGKKTQTTRREEGAEGEEEEEEEEKDEEGEDEREQSSDNENSDRENDDADGDEEEEEEEEEKEEDEEEEEGEEEKEREPAAVSEAGAKPKKNTKATVTASSDVDVDSTSSTIRQTERYTMIDSDQIFASTLLTILRQFSPKDKNKLMSKFLRYVVKFQEKL